MLSQSCMRRAWLATAIAGDNIGRGTSWKEGLKWQKNKCHIRSLRANGMEAYCATQTLVDSLFRLVHHAMHTPTTNQRLWQLPHPLKEVLWYIKKKRREKYIIELLVDAGQLNQLLPFLPHRNHAFLHYSSVRIGFVSTKCTTCQDSPWAAKSPDSVLIMMYRWYSGVSI